MLHTLRRVPQATLEFSNTLLTTPDARIGHSPGEFVWTHRNTSRARTPSTSAGPEVTSG